jgi:TolA-binding protein
LAGGLLVLIVKKYKNRDPAYDYKKADISPTKDFEENKDKSKIKELENKISDAEEEIEEEKEKEKMRSMERKIEKQKEELERFRKRNR